VPSSRREQGGLGGGTGQDLGARGSPKRQVSEGAVIWIGVAAFFLVVALRWAVVNAGVPAAPGR
jgi:hypothetical protein